VAKLEKGRGKVDVGRFKGLGEMTPPQLKETTMNPEKRVLLRALIDADAEEDTKERVHQLMGKKPELRFQFIKEQTELYGDRMAQVVDV
jgi:topoisomerase-4 subunit B